MAKHRKPSTVLPGAGVNHGYAPYIGRIGALAVALGIGAGLAAAPWVASAKPAAEQSGSAAATSAESTAKAPKPPKVPKNVSVSVNGVTVKQKGTAQAVSSGDGSRAVARGANSYAEATGDGAKASANGDNSRAIVRGEGSTAAARGTNAQASVGGSDSSARAGTNGTAVVTSGTRNSAKAFNGGTAGAEGEHNAAAASGPHSIAQVFGGADSKAAATGANSIAIVNAEGSTGDRKNTATATDGGRAEAGNAVTEAADANQGSDNTFNTAIARGAGSTALAGGYGNNNYNNKATALNGGIASRRRWKPPHQRSRARLRQSL